MRFLPEIPSSIRYIITVDEKSIFEFNYYQYKDIKDKPNFVRSKFLKTSTGNSLNKTVSIFWILHKKLIEKR